VSAQSWNNHGISNTNDDVLYFWIVYFVDNCRDDLQTEVGLAGP